MEFLHSMEPMLSNFHLNSKHIMVDEDLVCKINMADYKFSFDDNYKVHDPAWMSPEALKKKPEEINKKSADMWSMGVILWYIQTIIHFLFDYNLN
jgi:integrin-linked kinase